MVKVMPCSCRHRFQDLAYGRGKRVHNRTSRGWRCTVCGQDKTDGVAVPQQKETK